MLTLKELRNRFTYHKPIVKLNQQERYEDIRAKALQLATLLLEITPESREQSLAITCLEEVVFWSNAAIARHDTM